MAVVAAVRGLMTRHAAHLLNAPAPGEGAAAVHRRGGVPRSDAARGPHPPSPARPALSEVLIMYLARDQRAKKGWSVGVEALQAAGAQRKGDARPLFLSTSRPHLPLPSPCLPVTKKGAPRQVLLGLEQEVPVLCEPELNPHTLPVHSVLGFFVFGRERGREKTSR